MKANRRRAKTKTATRADRVERTFVFTDIVKSTDIRSTFIARMGETEGNERFGADILPFLEGEVPRTEATSREPLSRLCSRLTAGSTR